MKEKFIKPVLAVVILMCLVVLLIPNKSQSRYFYSLKNTIEITDGEEWDIENFETAFKKAVEAEGTKVSDCFISGWIPYEMEFHVLTNYNEYIRYYVDASKIEYLSIDEEPVYYVDGNSLWLDTTASIEQ